MIMPLPLVMVMTVSSAAGQTGGGALHEWPAGTTAKYEITRGEVQTLEIPGREASPTESSTVMQVTVTSLGPRQFSLQFTDVNTTSTSLDVAALIGLECRVTLDERGLITEMTGIDGNAFVEARGGGDLFREDLQLLFLYLPENGLAPGMEWVRDHSLTADQGGFVMERAFSDKYHSVEEVIFDETSSMKVTQSSGTRFYGSGNQSGAEMEIELTGTIESIVHVDRETGQLLHLEGGGKLEGFLTTQGRDITMRLQPAVKIRKVD